MESWEVHIGPKYLAKVEKNAVIPPSPGEASRRLIVLWDNLRRRRIELAPFEGEPGWTTAPVGSKVLVTGEGVKIVSVRLLESSAKGAGSDEQE